MTGLYFLFGLSVGAVIVASLAHFRISDLQEKVARLDGYLCEIWPRRKLTEKETQDWKSLYGKDDAA